MLEKMKPMIAEQLNVDESEIKAESNFKEDLGADSLDLFELVRAREEEFGVEIPAEEIVPENFNSAEGIWRLLERMKEEA